MPGDSTSTWRFLWAVHFLRARVSVFVGPWQPFPSKQQIAHIFVSGSACGFHDGNQKKASSWRTSSLRVSRRSLRIGGRGLGVGISPWQGNYCPRTPDPAPPCLPLARLLLHEFICARWSLPESPLTKLELLSQGEVASRESHLSPGHCQLLFLEQWAITHGAATQFFSSLSPMLQLSLLSLLADPCSPAQFGPVFSCSQSVAGMAEKRRRSCQDTLAAPFSVNELEVHSVDGACSNPGFLLEL